MPAAKILPGEYYVSNQNELITTVLGSCVSACIRDPVAGVGGMNHFMLPNSERGDWSGRDGVASNATRYGNYAMEHMINDILKHGGRRGNLEVKVFGGGQIISSMSSVGLNNINFIHEYIHIEGLQLLNEDVGDCYPRKIVFYPASGRVQVKKIRQLHNDALLQREQSYKQSIDHQPVAGEVELF
ncbi:MAG: chemoreceptor glutamine deamidase CheD [Chromatiaceae bacterium]|nr:chemoreceptor glutamine deamidase CheD [Gammaproteobacteria bacterium]MCP5426806.1 chemoreceptor glutamine deamidase CheD [Chromatiaceae bacterium]MCB1861522.1 chemoreceptor glutamine deamidase CheD [Gammaproteobacteria bacterium]MCB1872113.1 chemoreceptor glutamine deamidase CheD [Gammaproteobacteria bacterium]MCB1881144.1 chemoreceptor glutamine deamidase CheD [Gammaproteobacteria bacterium]